MKTNNHTYSFFLFTVIGISIWPSCNDNRFNEVESRLVENELIVSDAPVTDELSEEVDQQTIDELNHVLMEWGKELLVAAKKPATKSLIYEQIEKRFDDDYNVLISTLMSVAAEKKDKRLLRVRNNLTTKYSTRSLKKIAFESFVIIDKKTKVRYYPQLFIPFYTEMKSYVDDPMLIIGLDDEDSYVGYKLDENANLVKHQTPIDEKFAKENEVWAITINERVNENGQIEEDIVPIGGSTVRAKSVTNAVVESMSISKLNESFASGEAEVYMKRFSCFDVLPNEPGDQNIYWVGSSNHGNLIRKYSIDELFTPYFANFTYYSNWDPINGNSTGAKGDVLLYVIYEKDNWPAGLRTATITIQGRGCNVEPIPVTCLGTKRVEQFQYRSADGYYDAGTIYFPYGFPYAYEPRNACDFDYVTINGVGDLTWNSICQ